MSQTLTNCGGGAFFDAASAACVCVSASAMIAAAQPSKILIATLPPDVLILHLLITLAEE
jgi:hypothetical protein